MGPPIEVVGVHLVAAGSDAFGEVHQSDALVEGVASLEPLVNLAGVGGERGLQRRPLIAWLGG
jgi:hypothetical protein